MLFSSLPSFWHLQYRWFSWGVASLPEGKSRESVFSAAVYKIQASKCYIKSLPLVPKDKLLLPRWKVRCTAASWSRVCPPPPRSRTLNWHLETIYTNTRGKEGLFHFNSYEWHQYVGLHADKWGWGEARECISAGPCHMSWSERATHFCLWTFVTPALGYL